MYGHESITAIRSRSALDVNPPEYVSMALGRYARELGGGDRQRPFRVGGPVIRHQQRPKAAGYTRRSIRCELNRPSSGR